VVADEDCTRQVVKNPVPTAAKRFDVSPERACLILLPATLWTASEVTFIPYKNTPRAPKTCNIPKKTENVVIEARGRSMAA
jgi:hypothetical protein